MEHYYKNIEGWFDFENVYTFAVRALSGHFVEVGCYKGKSSAFLATEILNSGKKISLTCVDTFRNEDCPTLQDNPGDNFPVFWSHMSRFPFVEAAKGDSRDIAKIYPDDTLDFIFIDASHDYDNVKKDLEAWYPKLRPGGIIGGHDFTDHWPGVKQAVCEKYHADFTVIGGSWIHVKPNVSNPFNIKTVVMNYKDKRKIHFTQEFEKYGIVYDEFPCWEHDNGTIGNALTFQAIFRQYDGQDLIIFEDDVKFIRDPKDFDISLIPDDWDMIYLGANLKKNCTFVNEKFRRVTGAWTTHAAIYRAKFVERIIKEFRPLDHIAFDEWLRVNASTINQYITYPFFATQINGYSTILKSEVNYELIFNSQELL